MEDEQIDALLRIADALERIQECFENGVNVTITNEESIPIIIPSSVFVEQA